MYISKIISAVALVMSFFSWYTNASQQETAGNQQIDLNSLEQYINQEVQNHLQTIREREQAITERDERTKHKCYIAWWATLTTLSTALVPILLIGEPNENDSETVTLSILNGVCALIGASFTGYHIHKYRSLNQ